MDLSSAQRVVEYLEARNAALEVAPITDPRSHPYGVVGSQPHSANVSRCNVSPVEPELRDASPAVVTGPDELPAVDPDAATPQAFRVTALTPACEAYEQRASCVEPEVHAPAVGMIVGYRTGPSLGANPRQQRDGILGVKLALRIRELDEAVSLALEAHGFVWSTAGPGRGNHAAHPGWRVIVGDVAPSRGEIEWVDCDDFRSSWRERVFRVNLTMIVHWQCYLKES